MRKLKLVLYRDGRPGHEKQSLGIIRSLNQYAHVDISEITVEHFSFLQSFIQYICYFLHISGSQEIKTDIDLLIGTGSRTHIPMLLSKRITKARVITCMTPMRILRSSFDLCFVPIHDQTEAAENLFFTVGPPNISIVSTSHDRKKGLILVGGEDPDSHVWNSEMISGHIKEVLSRSEDMAWTISSSPRTPAQTEKILKDFDSTHENVTFHPFSQTKPGWVEAQYAVNKTVWVTGDSISMVYEALSAGCNVGILPVEWKRKNNKFHLSENYLIDHNRVITLKQLVDGDDQLRETHPLHEADRCARELLKRWWPENLP